MTRLVSLRHAGCAIFLGCSILPASAQTPPVKLSEGLNAHVEFVGRDKSAEKLTVALRLENGGNKVLFVLLAGEAPQAVDSTGTVYKLGSVSGIGRCPAFGTHYTKRCLHGYDGENAIPLSSFTQIEPGQSAPLTFQLRGEASHGPLAAFSASLAFWSAQSISSDGATPDDQKRRSLRLMPLSIPTVRVIEAQ